jgi:hypothetical protein
MRRRSAVASAPYPVLARCAATRRPLPAAATPSDPAGARPRTSIISARSRHARPNPSARPAAAASAHPDRPATTIRRARRSQVDANRRHQTSAATAVVPSAPPARSSPAIFAAEASWFPTRGQYRAPPLPCHAPQRARNRRRPGVLTAIQSGRSDGETLPVTQNASWPSRSRTEHSSAAQTACDGTSRRHRSGHKSRDRRWPATLRDFHQPPCRA